MRAYLPAYDLRKPRTLADALEALARAPGEWRPFAGGTDLMVLLEAGKLAHHKFISIAHLRELRGVVERPEGLAIGALTTYADLLASEAVRRDFPMLARAAAETGAVAIQNRGTLGGNIANASPAADSPPALLAYEAELELVSAGGARRVPYAAFHTGYKTSVLRPDELIARIHLPRPAAGAVHYYRKVGTRRAQAIAKVGLAGLAVLAPDGRIAAARLALASVAPVPLRAFATERVLEGSAPGAALRAAGRVALAREIAPIDDIRSTAAYRARVAANLLEEFLRAVEERTRTHGR
jgi:CO/xanthine dehydrogenase FAD-binding subunit